jgi:O-Antigen ligase
MSFPSPEQPAGGMRRPVALGRAAHAGPADPATAATDAFWQKVLVAMLLALVFYLPNQAQIRIEIPVRGLNMTNVLFLIALFALAMLHRPRDDRPTPIKMPIVLFIGVLTWGFLLALAGDHSAWIEDLTHYKNVVFYLLLYFLAYHAVRDRKTLRLLVLMTLFIAFTSTVLGVRQALDYGIGTFNENKRVAAPFGWSVFDANRSAIFFCIHLQIVLAMALFLKSRGWLRIACAVVFLMGVFAVFHTYSRQSYFILAVLLMLLTMRKNLLVAGLACLALYHYDAWVPETVLERIQMTSAEASAVPSKTPGYDPNWSSSDLPTAVPPTKPADDRQYDESTESRFILWEGAWEIIQEHPLGIGLARFKRTIGDHVPPQLAGKDAHNFYILLATEAGIFAPIFLLVLLVALLRLGQRLAKFKDDDEARALGVGFVMATLAVVLGNIYGSRFLDGDVMGNYWILAGLVARAWQIKQSEHVAGATPAAGRGAPSQRPHPAARPGVSAGLWPPQRPGAAPVQTTRW